MNLKKSQEIKKHLLKTGINEEQANEALESFKEAKALMAKATKYRLLAPIMVKKALRHTKVEDNRFPPEYWPYDFPEDLLGCDINGDAKYWEEINGVGMPMPISTDVNNKDEKNLCYWTDYKRHPRERYARWVWAGIRNRANNFLYSLGKPTTVREVKFYSYKTKNEYIRVYTQEGIWQMIRIKNYGLIQLRQHFGFKLSNLYGSYEDENKVLRFNPVPTKNNVFPKAPPIYTSFSLKKAKPIIE